MKRFLSFLGAACFLLASCGETKITPTKSVIEKESKAKVILLAGGDNCLGFSYTYHLEDLHSMVSEDKFNEYLEGYPTVKLAYKDMLTSHLEHKERKEFLPTSVASGRAPAEGYQYGNIGPELGMAEYLSAFYPNDEFYIIKFGGGGTSKISSQWNSRGGVFFNKMNEFFKGELSILKKQGVDFEIPSFCFIQGESDAKQVNYDYGEYLAPFIDAVRSEYSEYAPKDGMAFIDTAVDGYFVQGFKNVNADKKAIADGDVKNIYIPIEGTGITNQRDNSDRLHFDASGELKLGHFLANATMASADVKKADSSYVFPFVVPSEKKENELSSGYLDGNAFASSYSHSLKDNSFVFEFEVEDSCLHKDDAVGVDLSFVGYASKEYDEIMLYADGRTKALHYGTGTSPECLIGFDGEVKGTDKGFAVKIEIENKQLQTLKKARFLHQNKNINAKTLGVYGEIDNANYYDFFMVEEGTLLPHKEKRNGSFFGSTPLLPRTTGWNLEDDNGSEEAGINMNSTNSLNMITAINTKSSLGTFKADLSAISVINFDYYPKFGITVLDDERNGAFFYIDCQGSGFTMEGLHIGYCAINYGSFENYVDLGAAFSKASSYQMLSYASFEIVRNEENYVIKMNGDVFYEGTQFASIGRQPAYFGLCSFNVSFVATNYSFIK